MDATIVGVASALIVAGVGGLVKLVVSGIESHLKRQDTALDKIGERVGALEVRSAEISGLLQRRGLDQRRNEA